MYGNSLITVGLPLGNALIMCGIGMTLRVADFLAVARFPKPVLVGVVGHYLLLPLIGFMFAALFSTSLEYAVGFVLIAACPSANVSNVLTFLARGNLALAVTLSAICSIVTLASIPLLVNLALACFGGSAQHVRLSIGQTMLQLSLIVLLPIMIGMALRRYAPRLASLLQPCVGRLSLLFLILLVVVIALAQRDLVKASIFRLGPAALGMCATSIASGWCLARASRLSVPDAVTIAMEVGVQNCTLALVVALTILGMPAVALPVVAYGLLMFLPAFALVAAGRKVVAGSGRRRQETA